VAGLLLPVTFIDFGLSYAFFAYPVGILVYGSWLALLLAFSVSRTPSLAFAACRLRDAPLWR